jgi:hypothetical protein
MTKRPASPISDIALVVQPCSSAAPTVPVTPSVTSDTDHEVDNRAPNDKPDDVVLVPLTDRVADGGCSTRTTRDVSLRSSAHTVQAVTGRVTTSKPTSTSPSTENAVGFNASSSHAASTVPDRYTLPATFTLDNNDHVDALRQLSDRVWRWQRNRRQRRGVDPALETFANRFGRSRNNLHQNYVEMYGLIVSLRNTFTGGVNLNTYVTEFHSIVKRSQKRSRQAGHSQGWSTL